MELDERPGIGLEAFFGRYSSGNNWTLEAL